MAMLHQELDAVRLGRDRVALGRRDDLGVGHGHFVPADAPLVARMVQSQRAKTLPQPLKLARKAHRGLALSTDALAQAGAVGGMIKN